MTGTQCMTFYYNFYGQTMSCVIVYIKTTDGTEKVVWIKSGHWGDRWIKTQIEISEEKASYRVSYQFPSPKFLFKSERTKSTMTRV